MRWVYSPLFLVVGFLAACEPTPSSTYAHGGIIRGDTQEKALSLVFTGDQFAEGAEHIQQVLARHGVRGTFFFTGYFYRNADSEETIRALKRDGHYLGAHSDQHLLYCSWEDRDSLLVTHDVFVADVLDNYAEMEKFGIRRGEARYFMPPYEWYNDQISAWTEELGLKLVNFTPGTRSNADYTTPDLGERYVPSETIMESILAYEREDPDGLNGFMLLIHIGVGPKRTDKFYLYLDTLIQTLKEKGYAFKRIDALLQE